MKFNCYSNAQQQKANGTTVAPSFVSFSCSLTPSIYVVSLFFVLFHPAACFLDLHYPPILHNHMQTVGLIIIIPPVKYQVIVWLPYRYTVSLSRNNH